MIPRVAEENGCHERPALHPPMAGSEEPPSEHSRLLCNAVPRSACSGTVQTDASNLESYPAPLSFLVTVVESGCRTGINPYLDEMASPAPFEETGDPEIQADAKIEPLRCESIYSADTVAHLRKSFAVEGSPDPFGSSSALMIQCFVFMAAVVTGTAHLLLYEAALWNPETRKKEALFVPGTLYVAYYLLSLTMGHITSSMLYGVEGLKRCWDRRALLSMVPAVAFLAVVESMDVSVLVRIPPHTRQVLGQIRLPFLALIGCLFLRRRQSGVQWAFITGVTISVTGCFYVTATHTVPTEIVGMSLCCLQSLLAACGSTAAEITFKRWFHVPFCIQMVQARSLSLIASIVVLAAYCWKQGCGHRLFFTGWTYRIYLLVIWLAIRDWMQTFTLKLLSAMWKSLAGVLALCLTYLIQYILRKVSVDPLHILLIALVVVDVIGYALTKRPPHPAKPLALVPSTPK